MVEFITWIFSLKLDAVVGPWIKDNLIVLGFILGLPFLIYQWWWKNMQRIKQLKTKPLQAMEQIDLTSIDQYLNTDEGKSVIWTFINNNQHKLSEVEHDKNYSVTNDDLDDGLRDR
jgi:hypothetical protein